jgi:hypothetical protein
MRSRQISTPPVEWQQRLLPLQSLQLLLLVLLHQLARKLHVEQQLLEERRPRWMPGWLPLALPLLAPPGRQVAGLP